MTAKRITLARTFRAPIADVWDLWTTKDGIESWWGPDGFEVTVHRLDLRPGGELYYVMAATTPAALAVMQREGMPVATHHHCTYTEVVRHRRLAYVHPADFIPNVASYDVATVVELDERDGVVEMRLTFDAMHDDAWTRRAVMGWELELAQLAGILEQEERT